MNAHSSPPEPGMFARLGQSLNRHRAPAIAGAIAVVLVGIVAALIFADSDAPVTRKVQEFTIVTITPPPPPPPPPPPEQVEPEEVVEPEQMVEPEMEQEVAEEIEEEAPAESSDEPPGELPDLQTPGEGFDLAGTQGGTGVLGGGGGAGGSRWGRYVSMVTKEMSAALYANPKTKHMVTQVRVRVWTDATGRVTRILLQPSTGDAEIDGAVRESLTTVSFTEPPPADMPMPIITRVTARRSSS